MVEFPARPPKATPWEETFIPEPNSGCWLWLGSLNNKGYGNVRIDKKTRLAHKTIYEILIGPVPPRLELDHKCRVTCCVNPAHLEPVTHQVNIQRGWLLKRRTHCKNGHALEPSNLYTNADGWRGCRICSLERANRRRERLWKKGPGRRAPPGERNGSSKLTSDQVRAIIADQRLQRVIAAEYDIDQSTVSVIKSRKAWEHIR